VRKKGEAAPQPPQKGNASLDKQKIREAIEEHKRQQQEAMVAKSAQEPVKEEKTEPKKKVDSEIMYKYRSEREL